MTTCTTNTLSQRNASQPLATQISTFVAAVVNLPERALATAMVWQQHAYDRRQLLELEDWQLSDAGLTRAEAIHEAAKPIWTP